MLLFSGVNPALQLGMGVVGMQLMRSGCCASLRGKRDNFQWDSCNFEHRSPEYKINSSSLKRSRLKLAEESSLELLPDAPAKPLSGVSTERAPNSMDSRG